MPGSIVAAQAVEKSNTPDQAHVNGHCSGQGADGHDVDVSAPSAAPSEHAGELEKKEPAAGDAESGDHAKENGHIMTLPTQTKAEAQVIQNKKLEEGNGSDVAAGRSEAEDGTEVGMHDGAAAANGRPDEKQSSPETTPAGSDGPSDSPSCPASHSKAEASPDSAKAAADDGHVHTSLQRSVVSSAETAAVSKGASDGHAGGSGAASSEPVPAAAASGSAVPRQPSDKSAAASHVQAGPIEDQASIQAQPETAQNIGAGDGAGSLPPAEKEKSTAREDTETADQKLVASLIEAAADNTAPEKGDADGGSTGGVRAFALSDCAASSSLGGQEPSAEDKLAMATLLGLAGVQRPKSEEATGSENGDDDDGASAQESSSRPADGSDADDLDDEAKSGDAKDSKGAPRRGAKKKKDKEGAGEGDDNDDDGENEESEGGKSAKKTKKDEGDDAKPKGKKGKKQSGDAADRNLSREERKMLAIMRQFEQMEQKEKAKAGPTTPRSDGRPGVDESGDAEAPGSCKKRKEGDDEEAMSARKKPRPGDDENKTAGSPRKPDEAADAKAAPKPRGRPPLQKMTGKQKMLAEREAAGVLVALRAHRASTDAPHPVLPRKGSAPVVVSAAAAAVNTEYAVVQKCLRFRGKKSYCGVHAVQAALADLAEHEPHTRCAPDWLPAERKARLNPHRRLLDKKRFPAIKSCLAKWTQEREMREKNAHLETKVEVKCEPQDGEVKPEVMDLDLDKTDVKRECDEDKEEAAAAIKSEGGDNGIKLEGGEQSGDTGDAVAPAASSSTSKPDVKIPRREHSQGLQGDAPDRRDSDRHGPWAPPTSNHTGTDMMRIRDEPATSAQRITTGYGSLAISIPLGGAQHGSQYGWDQRARGAEASPQVKTESAGQDPANADQRWQRGAEGSAMWMGKRDSQSMSTSGPNSPSKSSNASNAANSWDRKDRVDSRSSKGDADQDARWQRGKDSPGHWMGKRDGPPMPSSPRVGGDATRNWDPRGRTSAWDQPPHPGDLQRESSFSKDVSQPERDMDRSSTIRNLPDMREIRREPSPPPMRRRVPSPPRSMYGGEMRDRGMDMAGGGVGGAGGGLSRESLRREREDALMRDREPPDREPPSRFMRSEIVRSEIRSKAPDRASDSPRSRGMLNQWDLGHRARSPRPIDRPMDRPRLEMGRAISPAGRDRSLSPRSKELQREMQAARERRGGDRKDEWGRDMPEARRDGSECSPGPDDRDLPPRQMLGGPGGAGRGGWWGGSVGRGRGGPSVDDRPPGGIVRRQRPSMFAARRPRD